MAKVDMASGEAGPGEPGRDFTRDIVKGDLDAGRWSRVIRGTLTELARTGPSRSYSRRDRDLNKTGE